MVYELKYKLQHGCSDTKFSELFGKKIMYAYCSRKYDYKLIPCNPTSEILEQAEMLYPNFDTWVITNYNQNHGNCIVKMNCTCYAEDTSLMKLLQEAGGLPVYPVRYELGWEYHKLICFNEIDLQNVLEVLHAMPAFELLSVSDKGDDALLNQSIFTNEIFQEVTETQRNILKKAFELGYYNIPREIKLSMIADDLGITRYAVEKSLRIAENKIMKMVMPFIYLEEKENQLKELAMAD